MHSCISSAFIGVVLLVWSLRPCRGSSSHVFVSNICFGAVQLVHVLCGSRGHVVALICTWVCCTLFWVGLVLAFVVAAAMSWLDSVHWWCQQLGIFVLHRLEC